MPAGLRLPTAAHIPTYDEELDRAGWFGSVLVRRHQWEVCYSTAAYLEVLATNSGHLALPPQVRDGLFGCLADLIDRFLGGQVTKRYLTELAWILSRAVYGRRSRCSTSPIHLTRGIRRGTQLEQHRRQPHRGDGVLHGRPSLSKLTKDGADKHPQPLVRRVDDRLVPAGPGSPIAPGGSPPRQSGTGRFHRHALRTSAVGDRCPRSAPGF
jgi:hypothetical protein